jgi:glucokinase
MEDVFAGVDVGGTSVKLAIGTADGELLAESAIPTDSHRGPDAVLQRIAEGLNHLARQTGARPKRIGVGIPGIVDIPRGVTKFLPNLMGHWKDVPAADTLSRLVGCPATLLNDVRTATLGELAYGHGRNPDIRSFVLMAIGTGIGGGVVMDRKLRLGPIGAAGEIGHQTIVPEGPRCGCGNHGCLETLASGTAIAAEGVRLVLMGLAPTLRDKCEGNTAKITAKLVAESADDGCDACRDAMVTAIHPDMIVIGGGVSRIGEVLMERIRDEVSRRVRMIPPDTIRIEASLLSDKAGVMGTLALASRGIESAPPQ